MLVRALQDCKPRVGTNMTTGGFADLPDKVAKDAIDKGWVEEATLDDHIKAIEEASKPKRVRRSAPKETTATDE